MSNVISLFAQNSSVSNSVNTNPDIIETINKKAVDRVFTIEEQPILTSDKNGVISTVEGKKGLFVNDNNINIVSDNYKVVQPNKVIETFESISGLTVDKVVSNPNTGGLLLSSKLENKYLNGDEHSTDLVFYTGHNGQYRTLLSIQTLRIACMNQMPAISKNKGLWLMNEKHYSTFSFDKMKKLIEELPLHLANFTNDYSKLVDIKLTKKEFLELFIEQFKIQSDTKAGEKNITKINGIYSYAKGQDTITNDNAYKAYNAVTFLLTHEGRNGKNNLEKQNIGNMNTSKNFFDKLVSLAS